MDRAINISLVMNISDVNNTERMVAESIYRHPFDSTAIFICAAFLLAMAVVGFVSNSVTIYVIAQSSKLRSTFNYFIVSLCASDLISALFSPLALYRRTWGFDNWVLSPFLCKICIGVVWIIAIGAGFVPFSIWTHSRKIDRRAKSIEAAWPSCTFTLSWFPQFQIYARAGYVMFFFTPMLLILMCSLVVSSIICYRRKMRVRGNGDSLTSPQNCVETIRQRKETWAILQLVFIVASYLFGYLPITVYHIYTTSTNIVSHNYRVMHWWFGMGEYICLRLSECINPFVYNLACRNTRKETIAVLRKLCMKRF